MKAPRLRFWKEVEIAAIAAASLIAAISFWWTAVRVPSRLPASLMVTPELEEVARRNDTALVRIRFHIANRSPSRVYVPALWYRAWGISLRARTPQDSAVSAAKRDAMPESYARYSVVRAQELVGSQRLVVRRDTWFQPGSESRYEEFVTVPVRDYDMVRVQVDYFFTKSVRRLTRVEWSFDAREGITPTIYFVGWNPYERPLGGTNPVQVRWKKRSGAGSSWNYSILPLHRTPPATATAEPEDGGGPDASR